MNRLPLLTFSHLRWDFVYQRPQHVMSRLAGTRPITFIEEPVATDGAPRLEVSTVAPGVQLIRPHLPPSATGFGDETAELLTPMLRGWLAERGIREHAAWLYTPMAVRIARALGPKGLVYDCMDELSKFLFAPAELIEREVELLACARVVFTGGQSLYRSKAARHPRVHCFPSSVDASHFGRGGLVEPDDQAAIGRPRLGFYGVLDERIDPALLAAMADAHPEWQLVMVGPVVKIDPSILPRRPNIHYLGMRSYDELPRYLAGWDVALLPFALGPATELISPTKTLEYMAAGRPTVSTPIADVAEPYGEIVYLGTGEAEFVAACERALDAPAAERSERTAKARAVIAQTSWDRTAAEMDAILTAEVDRPAPVRAAARRPRTARSRAPRTVVLGAGPTGLAAGLELGREALVIEREGRVGGWCRSIEQNGFTFDMAGHIMFSTDPYVHELYRLSLGDNVHWQEREAWIYSKSTYTRYPFQGSLYGLPVPVIRECLMGALEAQYGSWREGWARDRREQGCEPAAGHVKAGNGNGVSASASGNGNGNGAATSAAMRATPAPFRRVNGRIVGITDGAAEPLRDCCGDGILEAGLPVGRNGTHSDEPANFEEFIYRVWGAGIAKHFAVPYNRKLWTVPLEQMETSWLGGRVPMPNIAEMIEGALAPAVKPMGPNARFGYPLRGGFQALMDGLVPYIEAEIALDTEAVKVSPSTRTVVLSGGRVQRYRHLVSTIPLPELIRLIGDEAPRPVREAAARLQRVSIRCVNLGVGRPNLTEKHWIYYPEDTVFHRIFVQGNASPHCNPPGGFGLTCEISYSPTKPLPAEGDDLVARCVEDCRRVGIIGPDDPILASCQVDMPYAYVVYDHSRAASVALIRAWLAERDILLAGRYSEWEYYNSDHAFLAGKRVAEEVASRQLESERTTSEAPAQPAQAARLRLV